MSSSEINLEEVRSNLKEVQSFKLALTKCQVPGDQVVTISRLQFHLEDVIKQLSGLLEQDNIKIRSK